MTGLVVYRFGPQLCHVFDRIEAGGDRVAKAAASLRAAGRTNGSGPAYALGEHRTPLLDLAEEGEEDGELYDGRRRQGRGGSRGKGKPSKPVADEWEM